MFNKSTKISAFVIFAFISISITSCKSEGEKLVTNLEKCLGNVKTQSQANDLPKEQITDIAKCMLEHLDAEKQKMENKSPDEIAKFEKDYKESLDKSEYKDALQSLDYEKVKELANEDDSSNNK